MMRSNSDVITEHRELMNAFKNKTLMNNLRF